MPTPTCKLTIVPTYDFQRPRPVVVTDRDERERRQALRDRVHEATVERALAELGARHLPDDERKVLTVMVRAAATGKTVKAWQIAADADVTLKQLEAVCDRLLARGLIGPKIRKAL